MGLNERKEREREQRRYAILDAAETLFFSRDYDKVSMDDIASLAELNKATVYYYFKNKETLFSAVVLRGIHILNKMYQECAETQVPGITKVALLGNAYYRWTRQYPDYLPLIQYFSLKRFSEENPCTTEIWKAFGESRRFMSDAIKEGIRDGTVRDDMDPFLISMYLTVTSMSILSMNDQWKNLIEKEGFSYENFIKEFGRFITPAVDIQAAKEKPHFTDVRGFESYGYFLTEPVVVEPIKKKK
jgi:AcrR family transcriptional regulator